MQKIKMIGLVLLAGIVICGAAAYKENPEKITLRDFTMAMDNSGMTGWHNGKKQWQIQAGSVIKEQDKIIFRNVHNGMFMRDGQSPVQFHASLAEYNKEKGYIDFPEGLAFIVDDQSITIGKANWSEKDNRLTAEKISIAKADGIELKAEKMIFESTANCLTWQGPLDIIKSSEKDHKLVITTNQANYFPQDKKWQMDTQAEIKVFEGELLFCVIQTSHMVFQTDGAQVSFLDKVNITGESFSGECSKATLNDSILIGEDVHLNHNKLGMLTAGSMSATRDEHYLFRNGVTCSRGNGDRIEAMQADVDSNYDMKFSNAWGVVFGKKETKIRAATLVYHQNQDVAANGEVEVNRDEIILQSDSMDISSESSMIIANGNVVVQDGKGNVINTTRAKHDGKDRISFTGNVSIKQNNGTLVNGDFAEYDEKNKQIFVKGNVKAVKADGRWLKADVMQYDIKGRKTEFTGQVESGINE
jgi:lipopolysaccharide export system protein LptA